MERTKEELEKYLNEITLEELKNLKPIDLVSSKQYEEMLSENGNTEAEDVLKTYEKVISERTKSKQHVISEGIYIED